MVIEPLAWVIGFVVLVVVIAVYAIVRRSRGTDAENTEEEPRRERRAG